MSKSTYWIADTEGVKALVEGAEARDEWTKVHGWSVVDEPGPTDQVHVVHADPAVGPGRLPYGALAAGMDGLGWSAGPPSAPYDLTKDPVLVDQASAAPAAEPVKPKQTQAATGAASTKE